MAAQEPDVVHHRVLAGHPLDGHRARVDAVGVDADADHHVRPALRRLDHRLRRADALEGLGPVEQVDLRGQRVQANQHRVGLQRQRVADDVVPRSAGRSRGARQSPCGRRPVSSVHRRRPWRRATGCSPTCRRAAAARGRTSPARASPSSTDRLEDVLDRRASRRCRRSAARGRTPSSRRSRRAPANVFPLSRSRANVGTRRHTTFSMLISVRGVVLQADDHGRAGDVLHPPVLDPELVVEVRRRSRLPSARSGSAGRTSVRPAIVSRMAASCCPSKYASTAVNCQPGEGVRVQMPYCPPKKRTSSITFPVSCTPAMPEPMRKSMCARNQCCAYVPRIADRARVPVADLDVDVAHRRVEGPGSGVGRTAAAGPPVAPGPRAREEHHLVFGVPVLVAGRVGRQHEHRALRAVPDQPDRRPHVDGLRQPVPALGDEDDALADGFLHPVDRLLDGLGIVGDAVALRAERLEVHGLRIDRAHGVVGRPRPRRRGGEQDQRKGNESFQHGQLLPSGAVYRPARRRRREAQRSPAVASRHVPCAARPTAPLRTVTSVFSVMSRDEAPTMNVRFPPATVHR